jgi:hypothetical protein
LEDDGVGSNSVLPEDESNVSNSMADEALKNQKTYKRIPKKTSV